MTTDDSSSRFNFRNENYTDTQADSRTSEHYNNTYIHKHYSYTAALSSADTTKMILNHRLQFVCFCPGYTPSIVVTLGILGSRIVYRPGDFPIT